MELCTAFPGLSTWLVTCTHSDWGVVLFVYVRVRMGRTVLGEAKLTCTHMHALLCISVFQPCLPLHREGGTVK